MPQTPQLQTPPPQALPSAPMFSPPAPLSPMRLPPPPPTLKRLQQLCKTIPPLKIENALLPTDEQLFLTNTKEQSCSEIMIYKKKKKKIFQKKNPKKKKKKKKKKS